MLTMETNKQISNFQTHRRFVEEVACINVLAIHKIAAVLKWLRGHSAKVLSVGSNPIRGLKTKGIP